MKSAYFWCDFLSVVGGFWWSGSFSNNIAALRMLRLWRLSAGADDLYELHLAKLTSEDAFKNFLHLAWQLILVIHNFACSWFFATTMSAINWEKIIQDDSRYLSGSLSDLYLVYFSYGAAMLAGWGGPPPLSPDGLYSRTELVVWSMTAPISALCTAFVFAQLLEVVQQASAATDKHLSKLAELSSVLDSLFVPPNLKQRCLRYHSFLSIHNANKAEYDSLFSSMSLNLQQDIKVHLFDGLVRSAPFFAEVPEEVMTKLVLAFEEEVYGPGQYIFHQGESGDDLFFIMRGSVEVLVDGSPLAQLQVGSFFGEVALVNDSPRGASIRAQSFCMFAKLSRDVFTEVLDEDPQVKKFIVNCIAQRQTGASADQTDELQRTISGVASGDSPTAAHVPKHDAPIRKSMAGEVAAGNSRKTQGIFSRPAEEKRAAADNEQLNKVLADVGRMAQIIDRFQTKFNGIEIRLRNMEVYIARASPAATGGGRAG